jgi:adenylate cyclase
VSDVFISYARSTAMQAQQIAEALRSHGYVVWSDDDLPAHRAYAEVIAERLGQAKAVVVIWSADAVKSEWVESEADRARAHHKLVQLRIDAADLPMPFDRIQCADLTGWTGDPKAPAWRKVVGSIAELMAAAPAAAPAAPGGPPLAVLSFAPPGEPVLAVLAFDNLSGDAEMDYFSDGVSDEIQQTVARGADLKVIGRGSSFRFRGAGKGAKNVAAALSATHVLDGSVRRRGDQVRISAQLIECVHETTLWSERFDRDLSDIFALQDEIAAAVATALKVAFAPSGSAEAVDPAAYDLYLKARRPSLLDAATRAEKIKLLQQATTLAPRFARAWVELASLLVHDLRFEAPKEPYTVLRGRITSAIETALRIDPNLGEAYQILGRLEPFAAFTQRAALDRKALDVAPKDQQVLFWAFTFAFQTGRHNEALGYAERSYQLDPMDPISVEVYAYMLDSVGRYAESLALSDWLAGQWPDSELTIYAALASASQNADWKRFDALVATARARGLYTPTVRGLAWFAKNRRHPDPAGLQGALGWARQEAARTGVVPFEMLTGLYGLGLADEVFDLVDRVSFGFMFDPEGRWPSGETTAILFNPTHNTSMLRDPRFPRLCAKLGLCEFWVKSDLWPDCADTVADVYDFKAECRRLVQS